MQIPSDFPLDRDSVVLDLGAYHGVWSSKIYRSYHPTIHAFEPVMAYWRIACTLLPAVVNVYMYGLGAKDEYAEIHVAEDASSIHIGDGPTERVRIVAIDRFLREAEIKEVSVAKINIEGAEYDLLDHLIDAGLSNRFGYLVVQFHEDMPDAYARYAAIEAGLAKTHDRIQNYPFVWETWQRKDLR